MSRNREIADITQKDQTIAGIKTFSSSPIVPTPTTATQVASKGYADGLFVSASETVAGKVELATNAEVQTGTDTVRAVTPAGMRAGLNASGTAPIYACRAWVNFNGTGTVAIRASGNVSSITDNGVGDYTINFTTLMPDANYSWSGSIRNTITGVRTDACSISQETTWVNNNSNFRVYTSYVNEVVTVRIDSGYVNIQVFR